MNEVKILLIALIVMTNIYMEQLMDIELHIVVVTVNTKIYQITVM